MPTRPGFATIFCFHSDSDRIYDVDTFRKLNYASKSTNVGNSLAVLNPKAIADEAGIREGEEIEVQVKNKIISIRRSQKELSLSQKM